MFYHRGSCAIENPDDNSLLITGGLRQPDNSYYATSRVTKYRAGGVGIYNDMPSLNIARKNHACASYKNDLVTLTLYS